MLTLLVLGGLVSFFNFGIHALMTTLVVIVTRHTASRTDHLHGSVRLIALLAVTMLALMIAHVTEVAVWASFYGMAGFPIQETGTARFTGGYFEFAFENYTAIGYGDAVAGGGWRVIGPITGLNGLLLIGWSVAIIFEVMRLADVYVDPGKKSSR
jgi:Ion channel